MPLEIPSTIFIAGIDTDAGKSLASAILTLGLQANYWKPIQAGTTPHTDSQWVRKVTGLPPERFLPEAYCLSMPASPHAAAAEEDITIAASRLHPPTSDRTLIIEGAGGLMVPLRENYLFADWLEEHKIPTVLVVKTYLGSINHSLLSIEALQRRNIPLLGIIFNDGGRPESESVILKYAQAPLIGRIPQLERIDQEQLQTVFDQHFSQLHASPHHHI